MIMTTTTTTTIRMLKPQSLARKIDSISAKIGPICCRRKTKEVEETGGHGGQKPLLLEHDF